MDTKQHPRYDAVRQQVIAEEMQRRLTELYANDDVKPTFTPVETLAKEMVDRLPSMSGSILVLSDAGLLIAVLRRLKAEGLPKNGVLFIAHTEAVRDFVLKLGVAVELVCYNQIQDWLKKDMDMKFDIVIGNPPYQAHNGISSKLWVRFVIICEGILHDNGHMALVVPNSWTKPLSDAPSSLNKALNSAIFGNTLVGFDLDTTRYFNVGVVTSYFIIRKSGEETFKFLFPRFHSTAIKILGVAQELFISADTTVWKRFPVNQSGKTPIRMKKGIQYSDLDDESLRRSPKVIIPREIGYYVFNDAEGQFGFNNQARAMICASRQEAESAFSVFNSKLIRWVMKNLSWTPQTDFNLLSMIKMPKLNHIWTDAELYEYFGLTQEEIDLIESTVK